MTTPATITGWDDDDLAELAEVFGAPVAHARDQLRRPTTEDLPDPVALAMLQRAHDLEDQAICRALGMGWHPFEAEQDPEFVSLMNLAQACEREAIRLGRVAARRAA